MVMMYITAFPIVIAMRHASAPPRPDLSDINLGFPARRPPLLSRLRRLLTPGDAPGGVPGDDSSTLGKQVRAQILRDAALLPLAILLVVFLEWRGAVVPLVPGEATDSIFTAGALLQKDMPSSSLFDVAFEVVSAYGCVGMSVGSFMGPASLCADWGVWSKLVLVGVMMRGRHRGLEVILGGG